MNKIDFGKDDIKSLILKLAPPVMFAQLIQALYNIVDSFYIGKISDNGLTALSIIFPIQLLFIAVAVGTGVGVNTLIARFNGQDRYAEANEIKKVGSVLSLFTWLIFSVAMYFVMPEYVSNAANSIEIRALALSYGRITSLFSFGLFMESMWTKILQSEGNMKTPMIAQIIGAIINIILDPILIFGYFGVPALGITGAAIATITGQIFAATIVFKKGFSGFATFKTTVKNLKVIYKTSISSILMQSLTSVYIVCLNAILLKFSENAVTVLGIYYKLQSFFFIPLMSLQNCVVPIVTYNYSANLFDRCKKTIKYSAIVGSLAMGIGTLLFCIIPAQLVGIFTNTEDIILIAKSALPAISLSFIPCIFGMLFWVYFQSTGQVFFSILTPMLRQIFFLIPIGYLLSFIGLEWFWFTFPLSEFLTISVGFLCFYRNNKFKV